MALPEAYARNTAKYTVCRIMTVDPTNRIVEAILRDGGKVMIPVFDAQPAFRWPQVDEAWMIRRNGLDWELTGRLRNQYEQSIETLDPGELRLDADKVTDAQGRKILVEGDVEPPPPPPPPPLGESWHIVGTTGEPGFQNSWVNWGVGEEQAAFYKSPDGIVRLKGLIKSGTVAPAFYLPAGYRPALTKRFPTIANGALGIVVIGSDGAVTPSGSNANQDLSPVAFRAEA